MLARYLRRPAAVLGLLAVATGVLYSGSLYFGFVWDDIPQIVNSPIVRSWANLPRAFSSDLWYHVARHQVYYRPLFVVWSMLNYSLFGLRPWGWHLGAIVAHVAAVAAVFWLARKLKLEYWTAVLAAALFALHPIHIEPVAWVSAASDTMVTLFVALAFCFFLNGRARCANRILWQAGSWVLLACALLTKEMAVAFAGLVAVYAWLYPEGKAAPWRRRATSALWEVLPYVAITAAYVFVRSHALARATGQFDAQHGLLDMFRTLPLVLALDLRQMIVPLGLTGLYYTPYVTAMSAGRVLLPAVGLAAVAGLLWHWNRQERDNTVAFAALWMLVGLAPALYLRNFGNGDFVRDRYLYLPSIGFVILLALAVRKLPAWRRWNAATMQGCAVLALCLAYVTASVAQQVYWASELLVWTRGQELYPGNPYALVGLAAEYSERGAYDRAIELAETAVREHPDYGYGTLALAESYVRAGRFGEGRKWLDRFLAATPGYASTETGMSVLAGLYGRMGDYDRALEYCSAILRQEPDLYSAVYNCGNTHLLAGQYQEAERLLMQAVAMAPEQAAPRHFLGRALLADGRNREAEPYLEAAAVMDPSVWDYHYWLARSLETSGNAAGAKMEYQRALRLNSDSEDTRLRLAALEGK
jgi:tetratricopeptide (TPR) repeat protein